MPHDLPPWSTVYGYFRRWRQRRDYERLPQTSEAFIYIAMIRLMSRRLADF